MLDFYFFAIGLCIGSFLNVVLFRFDTDKSAMQGRSACPHCHRQLRWFELVPVFSYIFLRGRCRTCSGKISPVYPAVELTTGLAFLIYSLQNPVPGWHTLYFLTMLGVLILLTFFDLLYLILPDKIIFPAIGITAAYNLIFQRPMLLNMFITALVLMGVFVIVYIATRGQGMGFGDVKLVFLHGLIFGFPWGMFAVVSAVWLAGLIAIILLIFKKAGLKTALPLGTFLCIASIVIILFKQNIAHLLPSTIETISNIFA